MVCSERSFFSVVGAVGAGVAHGAGVVACAGDVVEVIAAECASDVVGAIFVVGARVLGGSDVGVSAVVGACMLVSAMVEMGVCVAVVGHKSMGELGTVGCGVLFVR